mmetsp:Transcript_2095/g.2430  ORF Transcript_2095/g.2430 Transcript_2095/m.2430 type:complete len:84 (+) Transcript_2095:1-252(+)
MPKSPHEFMINWLRKRSGVAMTSTRSIAQTNAMLKQELKQLTGCLEEAGTVIKEDKNAPADADEEEEEEDEDEEASEEKEDSL